MPLGHIVVAQNQNAFEFRSALHKFMVYSGQKSLNNTI